MLNILIVLPSGDGKEITGERERIIKVKTKNRKRNHGHEYR